MADSGKHRDAEGELQDGESLNAGHRPETRASETGTVDLDELWDEIRGHMGVCPSFFRLGSAEPAVARGLFDMAKFAYLESPPPALFKEKLFTYLSRFCRVRYCIARHAAFLLGKGYIAGDSAVPALTAQEVAELLAEPLPEGEARTRMLRALEALPAPLPEWPAFDDDVGKLVRVACAEVFLEPAGPEAAAWSGALRRLLGPQRYAQLMLFLAFVRTAHFWTEVHPDLRPEQDVDMVLREHAELAELLLAEDTDPAPAALETRLRSELRELREAAAMAEALRESEERLRALSHSLEEQVAERTAELHAKTKRSRRLVAELTSAEQRERKRLAALLHDDLQQLLYAVEMQLVLARGQAEDGSAVAVALDEAGKRIDEVVEAARDLTRQLRPPALYEAGLTPALEWLASEMAERHHLEIVVDMNELDADVVDRNLGDNVKVLLFECIRELLFNVVKYADVGVARVVLRTDTVKSETDMLHLVVEDEGEGFDVEALAEPRSDNGFGLFSIRERLAALDGSVTIESGIGEGTRVEMAIPIAASTDKPADQSVERLTMVGGREGTRSAVTSRRAQVRVIVADDHTVVRQGIAKLLTHDERTVVVAEAADGTEAVDSVAQQQPDVVLMDVNMPRMNGVDATRIIRRYWSETVVIGMSVQADRATEQSMLEAGATAFVPKSGDVEYMIEAILNATDHIPRTKE